MKAQMNQNGQPQLRVGILSFAHVHAVNYARQLLEMPGVEVRGCDTNATDPHAADPHADPRSNATPASELRGAAFAAEHGLDYADTLDELFAWQPHAVVIASENAMHRDLVERAAAAGAHILCEKPLATSREDAEAMIAACEVAGVSLMLAYPTRFTRQAKHLEALVQSGSLGTIIAASGANNSKLPVERAWFTDPDLAGGGALVDHIVHIADLLELACGERPVRVQASVNNILHRERLAGQAGQSGQATQAGATPVETGGLVTITYESGLIATIDCSWSHPASAPGWGGLSLELVGTLGVASISPYEKELRGFSETSRAALSLPFGDDAYRVMLDEFVAAARESRHALPDAAIGMRTLDIVLAAQESVRLGAPVDL